MKKAKLIYEDMDDLSPQEVETYRIAHQLGLSAPDLMQNANDPTLKLQLGVASKLITSEQLAKMFPEEKKAWVEKVLTPMCQQVIASQHSINMMILQNH